MAHGLVNVMLLWLACGDEIAVFELHDLCALRAKLSRDDHLAALGAGLHDEAKHAVARPADGEPAEELEAKRLGLRLGAEAAVRDTLGVPRGKAGG